MVIPQLETESKRREQQAAAEEALEREKLILEREKLALEREKTKQKPEPITVVIPQLEAENKKREQQAAAEVVRLEREKTEAEKKAKETESLRLKEQINIIEQYSNSTCAKFLENNNSKYEKSW